MGVKVIQLRVLLFSFEVFVVLNDLGAISKFEFQVVVVLKELLPVVENFVGHCKVFIHSQNIIWIVFALTVTIEDKANSEELILFKGTASIFLVNVNVSRRLLRWLVRILILGLLLSNVSNKRLINFFSLLLFCLVLHLEILECLLKILLVKLFLAIDIYHQVFTELDRILHQPWDGDGLLLITSFGLLFLVLSLLYNLNVHLIFEFILRVNPVHVFWHVLNHLLRGSGRFLGSSSLVENQNAFLYALLENLDRKSVV